MFEKAIVMGIYSVTPLHAGSGNEISYVDLPIQREAHTEFPVIWGQSLKGALREYYHYNAGKDVVEEDIVFGPEKKSDSMGAIGVGDAKILFFPVRSIKGVFAYVTSPLVIERFKRDLSYAGMENLEQKFQLNSDSSAIVAKGSKLKSSDGYIYLEEYKLGFEDKSEDLSKFVDIVNKLSPLPIDPQRVAIVSDNLFKYFLKNATEVVARVKIDYKKGTVDVESGALWWEEFLPSDTLLYSVIAMKKIKNDGSVSIMNSMKKVYDGKYIFVGGDATVGKGLSKIKLWIPVGDANEES